MKLAKINPKNLILSPKNLFRSKKSRSTVSKSVSSSFSSGTTSSTSSDISTTLNNHITGGIATPTSVLPQIAGDWSDLSSEMSLEILQAFKHIDGDNDGLVSKRELEVLLNRFGTDTPSQEELTLMLMEVGCENDGCISLESLMSKVGSACGPACDGELRETFEFFDADHDGKITAEELLAVFTVIGDDRCTLEDCRRMIAEVDNNKDGFVCFEDFSRMMELQR